MKKLLLISALLISQPASAADVVVGETVITTPDLSFVCVRVRGEVFNEVCFDPYDPQNDQVIIQACGIFRIGDFPYTDCTAWYPLDRVVIE